MLAVTHMVRDVYRYRELLWALTQRDIRIRYKQAAFGVAWAFFMPVLAIAAGLLFRLVLAFFSQQPLTAMQVSGVMVKTLPWLLFASIVNGASNSLLGNSGLIGKIYFPREVVPLSSILSSLVDFAISLGGLILLMTLGSLVLTGSAVAWTPWLLAAPLLLGLLVLLGLGLGLFLAAANLFLRDVKYIVQVMIQFGMFFSLVYFQVDELPTIHRWGMEIPLGKLLFVNPVAPILESLRCVCIQGTLPLEFWPWLGYSALVALIMLQLACVVFERAEFLFAEYL